MSVATDSTIFTTPYGKNDISQLNYLLGQTAVSTALGFICRISIPHCLLLGPISEGCRYTADTIIKQAIEQLPTHSSDFISNNKTIIKTALVGALFFITPGSFILKTAVYLFAEPIASNVSKSIEGLKAFFVAVKDDIYAHNQVSIDFIKNKISDLRDSGNRLGDDDPLGGPSSSNNTRRDLDQI